MSIRAFVAAIAVSGLAAACTEDAPPPALHDTAMAAVTAAEDDLIAFRHDLHRYPELSNEEQRTSAKVADALTALGFDVETGVGGYGVVGYLDGAGDGPLIAFRADMDAVRSDWPDPVPYASQIEGVRHICGHDMHTAIGIGLAEGFAAIRDRLPGDVMLIFQPAEEAGTGAEAMLTAGVFSARVPSAIFSLHTFPNEVGELAVMEGGMMAGRMLVTATATATSNGGGDLDAAATALRAALIDAGDIAAPAMLMPQTEPFIFVDVLPDGEAGPTTRTVRAFVMSAGIEDRPRVEATLRDAAASVATDEVAVSVTVTQALEGVNNDPALVQLASAAITAKADGVTVGPVPGVFPAFSEDFGSFQRSVPGVMYFLGVSNSAAGTVGFPHSPDYVADDGALIVGTEAMLAAMVAAMEDGAAP